MKEFIDKLIGRLEEYCKPDCNGCCSHCHFSSALGIVNQLAEEYNGDFCEWTYDEFEEKWQTDCEVLFELHDSDMEITHYCPFCGKKIKIAPYQPKGE